MLGQKSKRESFIVVWLFQISWDWTWRNLGEGLQFQAYQIVWIILIIKILLFYTICVHIIRFCQKRNKKFIFLIKEKYVIWKNKKRSKIKAA